MTERDELPVPELRDAEASEADALDQAVAASRDIDDAPPRISDDTEAPEADALEQATVVPAPLDEYGDHDA